MGTGPKGHLKILNMQMCINYIVNKRAIKDIKDARVQMCIKYTVAKRAIKCNIPKEKTSVMRA